MYFAPGVEWHSSMQASASSTCVSLASQIAPRFLLSATLAVMPTPLSVVPVVTSWPSAISSVARQAFPSCQALYTGFFSAGAGHGFL
eukprot:CAMPEP_0204276526 /NCGR_PEP_ID=MMETSP0468-20130131/28292_1 /ASSEMBLY_ACC=CAM_ASM_000383 /TAXON_ID=2969 /ORGANISM="Oxyrrhis marina" /LENGTH=86 /DNA_ID=CAMNT_0051253157 /DNA_START=219 /DNA_END=479 /DNA_ORIENTATION=+